MRTTYKDRPTSSDYSHKSSKCVYVSCISRSVGEGKGDGGVLQFNKILPTHADAGDGVNVYIIDT